jgi:glycosyltransferase involved in cell wall biosynthesis
LNPSVLILTFNEAANLPACLAALEWCDDIVVVDSYSNDDTVEIARSRGARVLQRKFSNFADQRNFGLETITFRHEWVLHLDADEVVTRRMYEEIALLAEDVPFDAFRIAGKLIFDGRWLRFASMYPVYQVRLIRRALRFVQVGHGQRESSGWRIGVLAEGYEHYGFSKGIQDWIERHRRYAAAEAELAVQAVRPHLSSLLSRDRVERRRASKLLSYRLPFRPLMRFLYVYVLRFGFLDGRPGWRYARLLAFYESLIDRNVHDLRILKASQR